MVPVETFLPFLTEAVPVIGYQCDFVSAAILIIGLASAAATIASKPGNVDPLEGPDPQDAIDKAVEAEKDVRGSRESFLARENSRGAIQLQAPTLKI